MTFPPPPPPPQKTFLLSILKITVKIRPDSEVKDKMQLLRRQIHLKNMTKRDRVYGAKPRLLQTSAAVCFMFLVCTLRSSQLVFWILESIQFAFRF